MSKDAINLASQKLSGFYPLSKTEATRTSSPDDAKFLRLVNDYPADIRWMYTEISNKIPSALEIIRADLYRMMALGLTPEQAAQNLQAGLGEWYEPAQSCKR
jgi:ABC-type glycerol-3-phosphate transport system substrate-binding protein